MTTTNKNYDINQIGNNPSIIEVGNSEDLQEEFKNYADNFSKAADLSIKHMISSSDNTILDTWYYPLVYLYRQSLELILKACILKKITNKEDDSNNIKNTIQDLGLCIDKIYSLYQLSPSDSENAKWLDEFIKDIAKVDSETDLFKYPFDTAKISASDKPKNISLRALYTNMNRAYKELSNIYESGSLSGISFPKEEPKLIVENNSQLSSNISWDFIGNSYEPYLLSYEENGAFLIEEAKDTHNLFLPACYMYRNATELLLKRIINESEILSQEEKENMFKIHDIKQLWNTAEETLKKSGANISESDFENYRALVTSLHNYDTESNKFKYPCDKNTKPYFIKKENLDINNVEDIFTDLTSTLNGLYQVLEDAYINNLSATKTANNNTSYKNIRDIGPNPAKVTIYNNKSLDENFYKYTVQFYNAADLMMKNLNKNKTDNSMLDTWFYPLVYLYRQSLELALKSCILKKTTSKEQANQIFSKVNHNLSLCKNEIYSLYGLSANDSKNAKWLDDFLEDITSIDDKSDMFRYPFNAKGDPLREQKTWVSLEALKTNMERAILEISSIYDTGKLTGNTFEERIPKLLVEGGTFYSCLFWSSEPKDYNPYWMGYEEAAEFLMEFSKKDDTKFLPACYLYRNNLELALKRIIFEDMNLPPQDCIDKINHSKHSIFKLWNEVEPVIKNEFPNGDPKVVNEARDFAKTFNEYDGSSSTFRYPCDKSGNVFFKKPTTFDANHVEECFENFIQFLGGIHEYLDDKNNLTNSQNTGKKLSLSSGNAANTTP